MLNRRTSLIALLLLAFTTIIVGAWGNLAIYVESYYSYNGHLQKQSIKMISSILILSINVSTLILPYLIRNFYNRYLLFYLPCLAAFFYFLFSKAGSIFILYFIVFMEGLAQRSCLNIINYTAARLFPKNKSLIIGVCLSGRAISTILWSIMMTKLINPDNLESNQFGLFPEEVANNFPFFTYSIGTSVLVSGMVGFLLIDPAIFNTEIDEDIVTLSDTDSIHNFEIFKSSYSIKSEFLLDDRRRERMKKINERNVLSRSVKIVNKENGERKKSTNSLEEYLRKASYERNTQLGIEMEEKYEEEHVLTEKELIRTYIFTPKFILIYISSFIRNIFYIYFANNFKTITIVSINNDQFISYVGSITFLMASVFQIFGGHLIDKFGFINITICVYGASLIIIVCYMTFPASKICFIFSMIIFRGLVGFNAVLNNSVVYSMYTKSIGMRLLKYFYTNSLVAVLTGSYIDFLLMEENNDYSKIWFFYVILIVFGIISMASSRKF